MTGLAKRIKPQSKMRARLFAKNAQRCCVCKASGVGLELHHIDGDPSNTVDANIAVLCVADHDRHHRPPVYASVKHGELTMEQIAQHKWSWESFVEEARSERPVVLATITGYGTDDVVHSAELVMHWPDRIEYCKVYHLRMGDMDRWTDDMIKEVTEVGKNIKILVTSKALPDEHCSNCGNEVSTLFTRGHAMDLIDDRWLDQSVCAIVVHADRPVIELAIGIGEKVVEEARLWLCDGTHLHLETGSRVVQLGLRRKLSVRTQVKRVVENLLCDWKAATVLLGAGDPGRPSCVSELVLPSCWEPASTTR